MAGLGVLKMTSSSIKASNHTSKSGTLPALMFGIPLAVGFWSLAMFGPIEIPLLKRYLGHPVELVEIIMFSCAMAALAWKYLSNRRENAALKSDLLPSWDEKLVSPLEAKKLLERLDTSPVWLTKTMVFRRVYIALGFVRQRGSAEDLDDQLRSASDMDSLEMDGSFGLTRFITWAIPILGFLGTVLGITGAISGVTPEMLEKSMSTVTDGLALAFDATALALGLTMACMFTSFLVEKSGEQILEKLDQWLDREISHRFIRVGTDQGPVMEILNRHIQELTQNSQSLVKTQVDLWGQAMEKLEQRQNDLAQTSMLVVKTGLEGALSSSLEIHRRSQAQQEEASSNLSRTLAGQMGLAAQAIREAGRDQHTAISTMLEGMSRQTAVLAELQHGEKHLVQLQRVLQENLQHLTQSGEFLEAVHCLTAAAHMLTSKVQGRPSEPFSYSVNPPASGPNWGSPGKAA